MQVFAKLRDEQPKFRHQIVAIAGDCSQPNLGISSQDRATLIREVSIVFHVAATVRFDEKLKLAVPINVRSTRDVINLCKEITNLKVLYENSKHLWKENLYNNLHFITRPTRWVFFEITMYPRLFLNQTALGIMIGWLFLTYHTLWLLIHTCLCLTKRRHYAILPVLYTCVHRVCKLSAKCNRGEILWPANGFW